MKILRYEKKKLKEENIKYDIIEKNLLYVPNFKMHIESWYGFGAFFKGEIYIQYDVWNNEFLSFGKTHVLRWLTFSIQQNDRKRNSMELLIKKREDKNYLYVYNYNLTIHKYTDENKFDRKYLKNIFHIWKFARMGYVGLTPYSDCVEVYAYKSGIFRKYYDKEFVINNIEDIITEIIINY